ARGTEPAAGPVPGLAPEKGPTACSTVVLAGGAWSRLFCRNLGIPLPQLQVRGSVLRTSRVDQAPEASLWAPSLGLRKRLDGGYNVAHGGRPHVDTGPGNFRFLKTLWPPPRRAPNRPSVRLATR